MSSHVPDESSPGSITQQADSQSAAQSSLLKTQWKDQTASKLHGDLCHTLFDMEQELLSTCQKLEQLVLITGKGSLRVAQSHLERSIAALMSSLRRGGVYKNGAVVLHLDIDHPDIIEFVQAPRNELPWAKRCVNVTTESVEPST